MKVLTYPFSEKSIRSLKVGDAVSITGRIYTGRDKLHKYFADGGKLPVSFEDGALYHCGPVVIKDGSDNYKVMAAGPTTSVRENPYEPDFIAKTKVRIIIGKGGMDKATLQAMHKHGCIYVQAVGGAAAVLASSVRKVSGVSLLDEFGYAEAIWHFDVENFVGVVAMDSHSRCLFDDVKSSSAEQLDKLLKKDINF